MTKSNKRQERRSFNPQVVRSSPTGGTESASSQPISSSACYMNPGQEIILGRPEADRIAPLNLQQNRGWRGRRRGCRRRWCSGVLRLRARLPFNRQRKRHGGISLGFGERPNGSSDALCAVKCLRGQRNFRRRLRSHGRTAKSIPPGRYTVTVANKEIGAGSWIRCNSQLWGLEYPNHMIATGCSHRHRTRRREHLPRQARWRAVNAPHLVALVRAGARFEKGTLVERRDESGGDQPVA
jgi:hypothetical protein